MSGLDELSEALAALIAVGSSLLVALRRLASRTRRVREERERRERLLLDPDGDDADWEL